MCALTSSCLDDFSDIVTLIYAVVITIFLGWKLGLFLGGGGSFFPSNNLDRTLPSASWPKFAVKGDYYEL